MHPLTLKRQAPEELVDFSRQQINDILSTVSGVNFVMLCTADGFELTSVYKKNRENIGKLAAVSSSILAMVQAFMHEIDLQDCQSLTLDAANGKALLTAVPHPQYPMVIMTLSAKYVLLGQLLFFVKKVSENILQYNLPE